MERLSLKTPVWLSNLLSDESVTDVCVNGAQGSFADRGKGLERLEFEWKEEDVRSWVLDQLSLLNKSWDARYPFVDASIGMDYRLHVVFPPLARQGILVSVRRLSRRTASLRWQGSSHFSFLAQRVVAGDSMLIAGATGSGKTTLAADLISHIPPSERILALEDTPELTPGHPHFLSLTSRPPNADGHGEITLRDLLRQTLRMRPDRIILGECRGSEVLELLQSLNTGHRGSLATLHANSARDALRRVELLCLLAARGTLPIGVIRELLSVGIQWVVKVEKAESGRRISEVLKVEGREGDTILMRPVLKIEA